MARNSPVVLRIVRNVDANRAVSAAFRRQCSRHARFCVGLITICLLELGLFGERRHQGIVFGFAMREDDLLQDFQAVLNVDEVGVRGKRAKISNCGSDGVYLLTDCLVQQPNLSEREVAVAGRCAWVLHYGRHGRGGGAFGM